MRKGSKYRRDLKQRELGVLQKLGFGCILVFNFAAVNFPVNINELILF